MLFSERYSSARSSGTSREVRTASAKRYAEPFQAPTIELVAAAQKPMRKSQRARTPKRSCIGSASTTALSAQCFAHRVTGLLVPSALIEAQRPLTLQTARQRGGLAPFAAGDAFHMVQERLPVSFGPCPLRHHKIVEVEVTPVVEVDVDGRTHHGNELSGLVAHRELAISV